MVELIVKRVSLLKQPSNLIASQRLCHRTCRSGRPRIVAREKWGDLLHSRTDERCQVRNAWRQLTCSEWAEWSKGFHDAELRFVDQRKNAEKTRTRKYLSATDALVEPPNNLPSRSTTRQCRRNHRLCGRLFVFGDFREECRGIPVEKSNDECSPFPSSFRHYFQNHGFHFQFFQSSSVNQSQQRSRVIFSSRAQNQM